jgi:hydroxymethylpyrimidine/phosphomethylpyrimidine kinase
MTAVFSDLGVKATKIGMLSRVDTIEAVAEGLQTLETGAVVLDPVMVAASGDPLLADSAVDTLISLLLPLADIVTPNLHEAARMLQGDVAADETQMHEHAERLLGLGANAVLLKGGHGAGEQSADLLLDREGNATWLRSDRVKTGNTHGTGCTLSSAIAAGLAKGEDMEAAVRSAKAYIQAAIAAADSLHIGSGHGPVHHFHAFWSK